MIEFVKKDGYKVLYVLDVPYQAEKIVRKGNNIIGYINGNVDWMFPNISNLEDFQLEEGLEFDISEEDEQALYQLDMDFRISLLEMGVSINDL